MMRTKSLHRQEGRPARRGNKQNNNTQSPHTSTPIIGRNVRSWGVGKWLSQTSSSPQQQPGTSGSYRLDSGLSLSPPLRERQLLQVHNQTPAMALVVKKLRDFLPVFCQAMAGCHFVKCCSLLGGTVSSSLVTPVAKSSSSSPPIFGRPSSPSAKSSPSRSPIRAWLGVDSSRHESTSSSFDETNAAAVLEAKMEVFFLLVGVESMYQSMVHAISPAFAQLLASCYSQTVKDLQLLRLALCDAFLVSHSGQSSQEETSEASHLSMAESITALAASLLVLVSFCQARIQCIQLQSALWHQPLHTSQANFGDAAVLFESIAPNLLMATQANPKASIVSSSAAVQPLASAIVNEIGAWSSLCQTTFSVQHCRFAESILGAQSTKLKLLQLQKMGVEKKKPSCLELWLQESLKAIVGSFPIIFDKVSAFAKPLYGFDEDMDTQPSAASPGGGSESAAQVFRSTAIADAFEANVMEALHKYEKLGAISVAVVIDAMRTSNVRVEGGFSLVDRGLPDTSADPEAAIRQQYPAVYLRTLGSVVSPSPGSPRTAPGDAAIPPSPTNSSAGLSLVGRGMRRDGSRRERLLRGSSRGYENDEIAATSSPKTSHRSLRSWSTDDFSVQGSPTINKKKHSNVMKSLEYESEEGPGTLHGAWPHSEWTTLASVISANNEDEERTASLYNNHRLHPPDLDLPSSSPGPRLSYGHQTLYCIESVSESMWLVVIMKNLEQTTSSGWHWQASRPTTENVEDDLRDLVTNLATMIRVADRFDDSSVQVFREKALERSSDEIGAGLAEELKERGFESGEIAEEGIFRLIKNQLKLLAQVNSPNAARGSSLPTMSRLLRRGRQGKMQKGLAGHAESAAALFLGRELMHTIVLD